MLPAWHVRSSSCSVQGQATEFIPWDLVLKRVRCQLTKESSSDLLHRHLQ